MNYAKKGTPLLILWVLLTCSAYSQGISGDAYKIANSRADIDTLPGEQPSTRIPDAHLRAAVKLIEHLRLDSLLAVRDISLLRERITGRDAVIKQQSERLEDYKKLTANYEKSLNNLSQQVGLSGGVVSLLQKQVRKERTRTWLVAAAGALVSGFTLYMTTK